MSQSTATAKRHTTNRPASGSNASSTAKIASQEAAEELPDLATYVTTYARQRPDVAALWCFGVGFVLGWKLKPW